MPSVTIVRLPSGSVLQRSGSGSASILLLHGVAGGAWSWEPQLAELTPGFTLSAWEARGHGLARRVEDAGLADYFTDAREALDEVVSRDGPAFIAGHSMGGLLALALAAERPESVLGVALIDPVYAPEGDRHGGPLAGPARLLLGPLVRDLERNGPATRVLGRWIFAQSFEDSAFMERAWKRQRTQVPVEYPKMMYEAFEGTSGFANRAFARELAMPVLLAEPRSSAPRFPALHDDLAHLGERFTYVAIDGGHYLQLDRSAAQVSRALREFVTRWSR